MDNENNVYKIDLLTPNRQLNQGGTKTNPLCIGIETDESSYNIKFQFNNADLVTSCYCMVQLEAANGNKSVQEILFKNKSTPAIIDEKQDIQDGVLTINWKPNNFIMQEKGLVKFAFQFYKINGNTNKYSFILNTAPIYGYVHEGLNIVQSIGENVYPSELADLYNKYNSLLKDEDISDLDSFNDVKMYLQTLVPYNIKTQLQDISENDIPTDDGYLYLLAYDPRQKRYFYTPTALLDSDVVYANVWNVPETKDGYVKTDLEGIPKEKDPTDSIGPEEIEV